MNCFPDHIGWDNWGEMMCDVALFEPLVREACATFGYVPSRVEAGFPGSNAVFLADEHYVVKLFPPLFADDAEAERACYRAIHRHHVPNTPTLYAEGTLRSGGHTWPYLVISYLPGEAARDVWASLDAVRRFEIARWLSKWVSAYRDLSDPFDPSSPLGGGGWPDRVLEALADNLDELKKAGCQSEFISSLDAFARGQLASRSRKIGLTHCDLTEDHLLIAGDRYSIIDFADSRMAIECVEWVTVWFGLFARDERAFVEFLRGLNWTWDADACHELMLGTLLHGFGAEILLSVVGERLLHYRCAEDLLGEYPATK